MKFRGKPIGLVHVCGWSGCTLVLVGHVARFVYSGQKCPEYTNLGYIIPLRTLVYLLYNFIVNIPVLTILT